jgi:hypothetical protein
MNEGMLKFICAITGHDEETIKQMYRDWLESPSSKQAYEESDILMGNLPEYYTKWGSLLIAAIGDKHSYNKEDILRAMYLASTETEWDKNGN